MSQTANALGAARVFEDTSALGARRSRGGFFTTLALLALAWPALAAEEVRFTISNPARLPVATVARLCGFHHPSRFAKLYRERYLEYPSETARL